MSKRIQSMRQAFKDELQKLGSKHDWSHITSQIGMFGYTGLNKESVKRIADEYHIYMLGSGRINVAAMTSKNVAIVAKAFHEVTKDLDTIQG